MSVTSNVCAILNEVCIPAAQTVQNTSTLLSPRTTLSAVHKDGMGNKYVSKTRVARQSVELRNRTNASFLWGFEKWANCLTLEEVKSREAGDMVLAVAAGVPLVAIV